MKRKDAIKLIQSMQLMLLDENGEPISDLYHALETAVEALKEPDILKVSFARKADKKLAETLKEAIRSAPIMIMACENAERRQHGSWINTADHGMSDNIVCDQCGYDSIARYDFCPNCGAGMRIEGWRT